MMISAWTILVIEMMGVDCIAYRTDPWAQTKSTLSAHDLTAPLTNHPMNRHCVTTDRQGGWTGWSTCPASIEVRISLISCSAPTVPFTLRIAPIGDEKYSLAVIIIRVGIVLIR
jgi:hypothetical protein